MRKQDEIELLKNTIQHYEQLIRKMSVPFIQSIVDNTVLVPIVGFINEERFQNIQQQLIEHLAVHRETDCVILDFSAVDVKQLTTSELTELAFGIKQLNQTMQCMGIRPIAVGFHPQLVREMVTTQIEVTFESYVNFKTALRTLVKEGKALIIDDK